VFTLKRRCIKPRKICSDIPTIKGADGVIFQAAFAVLTAAMGLSTPVPYPFSAALSMLLLTALLCGCNFPLIRKAQ